MQESEATKKDCDSKQIICSTLSVDASRVELKGEHEVKWMEAGFGTGPCMTRTVKWRPKSISRDHKSCVVASCLLLVSFSISNSCTFTFAQDYEQPSSTSPCRPARPQPSESS